MGKKMGTFHSPMNKIVHAFACAVATLALLATSHSARAQPASAASTSSILMYAEQGWSKNDREEFYTTSQGSHLMPYGWFRALRRLDADEPFAADQLQRYGYLLNDQGGERLPIGFVIDGDGASGQVGMTCAACHTAQLEYQKGGVNYVLRLDGAPANADFQQFLSDLKDAANATVAQPARFDVFARAVLGASYSAAGAARLKTDFQNWAAQFTDFMARSLPDTPWGPGRLDAFGMIFNRVSARDLDLPANYRKADAPVSYPFLWNASRQDHTQWNGAVPNGLYLQALARNTGEVLGVFADFAPRTVFPPVVDFRANSADLQGLEKLEEKVVALKPPPWPRQLFGLNDQLVARGRPLFEQNCGYCHSERHTPDGLAWITPIKAVGTDPRMVLNSERTSNPGLFNRTFRPPPAFLSLFSDPAKTSEILASSVIGVILSGTLDPSANFDAGVWRAFGKDLASLSPGEKLDVTSAVQQRLTGLYSKQPIADAGAAYEARVLYGIWATAPYLHNGSVPNLWELLLPARQRTTRFMTGSRLFDPQKVGYVTDQSPFKNGVFSADPLNANGNGNAGHEYGTALTDEERWAIIEYMKTL